MSIVPPPARLLGNGYPTSDGKPMAETDWHRELMLDLISTLQAFFADRPQVYVSGNLLLFYEEGNRRKHVSPDVFVVFGVAGVNRPNYLLWQEGQPPRVVIELTSKSTRDEDLTTKMALYRDVLAVREYFLFDPREEFLTPSLQGYRLRGGAYQPIRPRAGRLPSQGLGLHLERDGWVLRLWNPATEQRLLLPREVAEAEHRLREQAEAHAREAEAHAREADIQAREADIQAREAEAHAREAEAHAREAEAHAREAEERANLVAAENARLLRLLEQAGIRPTGP